jgi:predicted ATP-grasp superfamily ATP-dependent carboligase
MAEILVAGVSARALAGAARNAGFRPLAADLFGDLDLQDIAEASIRIDGDLDAGIRWTALIAAIEALAADHHPVGLVCGSGFEDRPFMLERLAQRWSIFGNSAEAVARAKDPAKLAEICDRLGIPHPRWNCGPRPAGWLHKLRGGAGGAHIRIDANAPTPSVATGEDRYWQEPVAGAPVAALVLANGTQAIVLGLTAQWCDPAAHAPFRYGGAVRPAALDAAVETQLNRAARAVVEELALIGLNSVDFLVDGDGWNLIEVNPRPGATLDVFEPEAKLFAMHMSACGGRIPTRAPSLPGAVAAGIVYAREKIEVAPEIAWPDWTADRQVPGTVLTEGAPICTVLARADDPQRARQIALERSSMLQEMLGAPRTRRRAAG